jgi:hypothetical protein
LFSAMNLRTGHRLVLRRPNMRQEHFQPTFKGLG